MMEIFASTSAAQYMIFATALIGLLASIFNAWQGRKRDTKIQEIHVSLDGRLTQLTDLIAKSSHAEGMLEGKAEEKANQDNGRILP